MDSLRLSSSIKDLKSFNLWQSVFAEFLGTFLLAFIGFGSVFSNMNPVKVGLGFGLAGVVIIYCIGPISGGNINPAVSMGLLVARQISFIRFILYFLVQIIGATFGYKLIFILTNGKVLTKSFLSVNTTSTFLETNLKKDILNLIINWRNETLYFMKLNKYTLDGIQSNMTLLTMSLNKTISNFINKGINEYFKGNLIITENIDKIEGMHLKILCEMVISFVLVFTVMRLCVEKSRSETEKGLAPLIIGISITIGVYCGMNISGGSMNPAVSLGKYFWTGSKGIMSHIAGPLIGGFLAGILQQFVFTSNISLKHISSYLFSSEFDNDESSINEKQNDIQLTDTTKSGRYSPDIEHVQNSQQ